MEYDVFISHASEDKDFVEPLAGELQKAGLKVWYDAFEIKLGDDIAEKITQGLLRSRYGVIVLSKTFLEKKRWTEAELNALINRQATDGKKVILPIWHKITADELKQYNPILAGKRAARSEDGLEIVVNQIVDACSEPDDTKPSSIFQTGGEYGLREQCLEIIRKDDIIAWQKLINQVSSPIPDQLKEWKKQGEEARRKGGEAWEKAVYDAAQICLPGFVPIFSSVEAGNLDFWKKSVGILRRLAILEDQMGGGLCVALRIGGSMLSVAGFLGLSIATSLRLFDFINEWMCLRLPGRTQGEREISWLDFYLANRLPEEVSFDKKDPFIFLRSLAQTDLLSNFFPDEDRTTHNLFLMNLLSSLIELRQSALIQKEREAIFDRPQDFHCQVFPFWCIMGNEMFITSTLDLFGDSQAVYNYVFPRHEIKIEELWGVWKQWKIVCVKYWRTGYGFNMPMIKYMTLPGEPVD